MDFLDDNTSDWRKTCPPSRHKDFRNELPLLTTVQLHHRTIMLPKRRQRQTKRRVAGGLFFLHACCSLISLHRLRSCDLAEESNDESGASCKNPFQVITPVI